MWANENRGYSLKQNFSTMKRRNFIASGIIGSLAGSGTLSDALAQPFEDKPRAITNKIKKKPLSPIYIKPDKSPEYRGSAKIRFEQTNNQISTWDYIIPPKTMGPAPHVHKDLDEIMRVVKGTVTVMVGEEIIDVEEGGWHLRPHGIVHTFWNATDQPAVMLDIYPNQNFEVFLEEALRLFAEFAKKGISPESPEAIKIMDKLGKEWGITAYHDQRKPLMEKYGLK